MKTSDIIMKGDAIESFERVENINEIILLGDKGGVRRITILRKRIQDGAMKILK